MAIPSNPLSAGTQVGAENQKVIKTKLLKVEGKTMIFGNTVYQISNISQISVIDLTTTKSIPWVYIALLIIGGLITLTLELWLLVIILWGAAGALYYFSTKNRRDEKYGLQITANSGLSTVLVSDYMDFLVEVAVTLTNIMNEKKEESVTFNFDNRQIFDSISGSTVVTGNVSGSVVNSVS